MKLSAILKQKTTRTGIAAILTAVAAYVTQEIALDAALQLIFTGLLGIFLRQGIAKLNNK